MASNRRRQTGTRCRLFSLRKNKKIDLHHLAKPGHKLLLWCLDRDGGPLPDGVEVFESNITVQAPVELWHGGLYECVASYYDIRAAFKFNITVRPRVAQLGMPESLSFLFFTMTS